MELDYADWKCGHCEKIAHGTFSQVVCSECGQDRRRGVDWKFVTKSIKLVLSDGKAHRVHTKYRGAVLALLCTTKLMAMSKRPARSSRTWHTPHLHQAADLTTGSLLRLLADQL
jgi:hypothetical protein